jgi:hypothetical protein
MIHTYGTNIYNVRTLDNHALRARLLGIDGVNMSAGWRAESVCIRERCVSTSAEVGEAEYR